MARYAWPPGESILWQGTPVTFLEYDSLKHITLVRLPGGMLHNEVWVKAAETTGAPPVVVEPEPDPNRGFEIGDLVVCGGRTLRILELGDRGALLGASALGYAEDVWRDLYRLAPAKTRKSACPGCNQAPCAGGYISCRGLADSVDVPMAERHATENAIDLARKVAAQEARYTYPDDCTAPDAANPLLRPTP